MGVPKRGAQVTEALRGGVLEIARKTDATSHPQSTGHQWRRTFEGQ